MKYSKTVDKDKFYTKAEVAKKCISLVTDIKTYDVIVEPSAGDGKFSNNLFNVKAFDIAPENPNIKKQDFLALKNIEGNRLLFIGNPPFGIRNVLSKAFITHSINLGATTIAFILPDVFTKLQNQKIFPAEWHLKKIYKLKDNSFTIDNEEYHVPCSFFIWTKDKVKKDLRKRLLSQVKEFSFLPRGDTAATFCINGNNGKIKNITEVTNEKAEHYIKTSLDRSIFENLQYDFKSSVNGGVSWIGQQEILEAYIKYKNNNK